MRAVCEGPKSSALSVAMIEGTAQVEKPNRLADINRYAEGIEKAKSA